MMKARLNNRTLLIILILLAGIFVVTRFTGVSRKGRTLNTDIIKIDTASVTTMHLFPYAAGGEELVFQKKGNSWTVTREDITAPVDKPSFLNALGELLNLKTDQLVARSEDKWPDFHVNDSLGTRLIIKEGKKTTLDMIIGRFDYKPVQDPYGGYGQNRGTGITYVRSYHEDEVYAVQGFLAMSFNRNFQSWRDRSLIRFTPSQLTRIVYDYPADTGFIAQKGDAGWMVGGLPADSALMGTYLNGLSGKRAFDFVDNVQFSSAPDYRVTFEGDNMQPLQVKAYTGSDGEFYINSSINPESWFEIQREGLFSDLFKSAGHFISGEKE